MANAFEKAFGIPLPKCCNLGECCKGASPSKPYAQLMQRAAEGDEFARNFFSIMQPYATREDAEKVVPGLVKRMIAAAKKLPEFENPEEELVFYHCRYLLPDNRCGVHEDRPQFCRDYPDTPFVVTAPGCAYEGWVSACKQKYQQMKAEVDELKNLKAELAVLKSQLSQNHGYDQDSLLIPMDGSPVAYLPGMTFGAPFKSFHMFQSLFGLQEASS